MLPFYRCDELKRQYTGALCGLGSNPNNSESLYREHDIEITFDTLFDQEDLNEVRLIVIAVLWIRRCCLDQ